MNAPGKSTGAAEQAAEAATARAGSGRTRAHVKGSDRPDLAELCRKIAALEHDLQRAQRLATQGMLAAMVGHEIKNYLGIALGLSQLLRERQPLQAEALTPIIRAIELAGKVSEPLTQLARPLASKPRLVHLDTLAAETCAMLSDLVLRQLRFENVSDGPLPVWVDPLELDQILVNLILNARDATDETTGEITVTLGLRGGDVATASRYLCVRDNGAGIPTEVRQRLFTEYFTTKPDGRGTGLGLANVQRLVTKAGGTLDLHTAPGCGTAFTIVLPPAGG